MVHVEAFAAGDFQLVRVEAELVQDGRVDVGDVMPVLDGVEAEFVGRAVGDAAFDAAAGQPGAEALGMVIAAGAFGAGRAAEFGAADDERLVQQSALLEVLEQAGDRLDRPAQRACHGSL